MRHFRDDFLPQRSGAKSGVCFFGAAFDTSLSSLTHRAVNQRGSNFFPNLSFSVAYQKVFKRINFFVDICCKIRTNVFFVRSPACNKHASNHSSESALRRKRKKCSFIYSYTTQSLYFGRLAYTRFDLWCGISPELLRYFFINLSIVKEFPSPVLCRLWDFYIRKHAP